MKKKHVSISPFYKQDDIFQRQEDYYTQILLRQNKKVNPLSHSEVPKSITNKQLIENLSKSQKKFDNGNKQVKFNQFPQYLNGSQQRNKQVSQKQGSFINQQKNSKIILIQDDYSINVENSKNTINNNSFNNYEYSSSKIQEKQKASNQFEFLNQNSIRFNKTQMIQKNDPYLEEAIKQNQYLLEKLQKISFGMDQRQSEAQLSSNAYILPHYKNQEYTTQHKILGQQHNQIEELTKKIFNNQKVINSMKNVRQTLVQRIGNIKKLDDEIYKKLQSERIQQIEDYLKTAKNALQQGESVQKIGFLLRKILY